MEKVRSEISANNGTVTNWGDAESSIHKISYQYTDLEGNINKVTLAANQATGAITKSVNQVPQINNFEKALTSLGTKIKQVTTYWLAFYMNPMMGISYFKNIIGYVKDLDSALTELRVVSNASDGELSNIAKQAYDVAQAVGSTTTDIVKSVTEWRRLGESVSDSMSLAEQAARLSTGGLMSTDVATEALTSAMKAYGYEVQDVYKIVDQFIYLGKLLPIRYSNVV
jgi:methyl-accepting chemotaxis protein